MRQIRRHDAGLHSLLAVGAVEDGGALGELVDIGRHGLGHPVRLVQLRPQVCGQWMKGAVSPGESQCLVRLNLAEREAGTLCRYGVATHHRR